MSRNKIQETAMIIIYIAMTNYYIGNDINIEDLLTSYNDVSYSDIDIFIKEAVIKSLINLKTIVSDVQNKLTNWKFDRINRLAQAILILAVTHYRYIEKVDKSIVIDNAVRLAKKYLDDGDYRLINAVLDATL